MENDGKVIALLIDAENVSPKYIKTIIDEVEKGGARFGRKTLYVVMIKVIAPLLLIILLLKSLGVLTVI